MKTNTYINSTIASSTAENDTKSQHSIFNIPCSIFDIPCSIFYKGMSSYDLRLFTQSFSKAIIAAMLIIVLLFSLSPLVSQEWTEPVNVSNMPNHLNQEADLVIDHRGVLHVVWVMRMSSSWWKIMYTYSEDDGETWAQPFDLLNNNDLWMAQPHIACNSINHLFVTYTHDYLGWTTEGTVIKMLVFDDHQWSEPILVSEGMPGSHYSKVIIDHNDRVYVFWDYGSTGDDYYRYLENNIWSPPYCPYPGNNKIYALMEAEVSGQNSLHWIGASLGGGYFMERLHYFYYDYDLNLWMEPQMPVQDTITVGIDIALNSSGFPECVYRTYPSPDDKTKHIKKEGNYWSEPELVAGTERTQINQNIVIDRNNDKHIVEAAYNNNLTHLIHYRTLQNEWYSTIIDSSTNFCNPTKLIFYNNKLYLVYFKDSIPGTPDDDIFFTKYDVVTGQMELPMNLPDLKIYPNPGRDNMYIEFENNKEQHIFLSVYDITGRHINTLINKNIPPGAQRILWNGTDKNGKEAKSGSYLVRLKSGRNTVTQIVEIIK